MTKTIIYNQDIYLTPQQLASIRVALKHYAKRGELTKVGLICEHLCKTTFNFSNFEKL